MWGLCSLPPAVAAATEPQGPRTHTLGACMAAHNGTTHCEYIPPRGESPANSSDAPLLDGVRCMATGRSAESKPRPPTLHEMPRQWESPRVWHCFGIKQWRTYRAGPLAAVLEAGCSARSVRLRSVPPQVLTVLSAGGAQLGTAAVATDNEVKLWRYAHVLVRQSALKSGIAATELVQCDRQQRQTQAINSAAF